MALTPNYSFALTLAGLNVREVQTGKLLRRSPGFAPRACVNLVLANGRVFWTSGANGMIYCWEPAPPDGGTTLRIRRNSSRPQQTSDSQSQ